MNLVSDLDLPAFDYAAPDFSADRYHAQLAGIRQHGWLARSPLAYIVLDHDAGEFFLRSRKTAFPGRQIAEFFGVTSGPLAGHIDANILNLGGEHHRRLRALVGPGAHAARRRSLAPGDARLPGGPVGAGRRRRRLRLRGRGGPAVPLADDRDRARRAARRTPGGCTPGPPGCSGSSTSGPSRPAATTSSGRSPRSEEYVTGLLEARRAAPGDDLISSLLAARDQGDRLSAAECVQLVVNLLAGGIDTTAGQLAHAIRLFAGHPGQWARLAADPGLAPRAVDEVLRFEPVTPFTARICLEQVEFRDVIFPAGTIVAVCAERANREGEGGEAFDITAARAGRLLTFGAGTHYCLGANLARAELEEALAFLAPRAPGLALDGPPQLGGVEGIYGIDKLPVTWSGSSAMNPNHGRAPDVS